MGLQIAGYNEDGYPEYEWVDDPVDQYVQYNDYQPTDTSNTEEPNVQTVLPDGGVDANGNPTYVDVAGNPVNSDGTPILNANARTPLSGGGFKTLNPDGSVTYEDPDGSVYTVNPNGTYTTKSQGQTWTYDPKQKSFVDAAGKALSNAPSMSADDWKKLVTAGTIAASMSSLNKPNVTPSGYQGGIPSLVATRSQIPGTYDPNRRPGSGGQRYFSDMAYTGAGDTAGTAAAQQRIAAGAADIVAQNRANPANQPVNKIVRTAPPSSGMMSLAGAVPMGGGMNTQNRPPVGGLASILGGDMRTPDSQNLARMLSGMNPPNARFSPDQLNALRMAGLGNIADASQTPRTVRPIDAPEADQSPAPETNEQYAAPVKAAKGRYLRGDTDGMADKIDTSIDDSQPAKLSHGEFVVPADVVSHLGNGNSEAGAKKLYQMMDKVRQARTGTKKQGKQINPDKFMPGGIAGETKKFVVGGTTGTTQGIGSAVSSGVTGTESNLSNWAGPYVTGMLGKAEALSNKPYEAYQGPLTAGASGLQEQAFQGGMNLNIPTQNMGGFAPQTFGAEQAQQYMNPYLQAALQPQLEEQRRQAQINLQPQLAKLTQAGGLGGGRQAIMQSEATRNLQAQQNQTIGQGYMDAYNKAMNQFNTEQNLGLQAQNLTNQYGLQALQQQAALGAQQRGIESEGITADIAQFEQEKLDPYKKLQFQQSMLQGLPVQAQQYNVAGQSTLQQILGALSDTQGAPAIVKSLQSLGIIPTS